MLPQVGGVTVGAHVVPTLRDARPVQLVGRFELLLDVGRVQMKPLVLSRVPRHPQHLQTPDLVSLQIVAAIKLDHVLLQRIDAEDVLHFEILQPAIGPFGVDKVLAVASEHPRSDAVVLQFRVLEIAQHGVGRRLVHGQVVVRTLP